MPAGPGAGVYELVSGLYGPLTWRRLPSPNGGDRLVIAQIDVQAPSP